MDRNEGIERTMNDEISEQALQLAAQAWAHHETSDKLMDPVLARAFARIIDQIFRDRPVIVQGSIAPMQAKDMRSMRDD